MKNLCQFGLAIIVSLLSSLILFLVLLLYSPKFNSWLILQAAKLVPEVSLEKADGLLLGKIHLSNLSYRTEQLTINIHSTSYHYNLASLFTQHIRFEALQMAGVDVEIKARTQATKEENKLTEFIMPAIFEIRNFTLNELQIKRQKEIYAVKKIHLALWYQGQSVRLSQFTLESDIAKLKGTAELLVKGQLPFKGELMIAKSIPNLAEIKADVSVHGNLDKIHLNANLLAPSKIHAQAWIQLSEGAPSFDLHMLWATLQWPLQGTKKYVSKNAQLTLKGTTEQYELSLDSQLFAKDLPLGQLHLVGQGDRRQLTLSHLSIEALQGNINSKGRISWTESIASDLQLEAKNLQLSSVLPDYPGEFNLTAKLTGQLFGYQDIRMQLSHLNGMLMGKPLSGTADIRYQPKLTTIKQLNVRVGTNQLTMQGTLAANNTLRFKLTAPNLHELSSDLQGELFAQGKLHDLLTKPSLQFDLHSAGLSFQEQKLGALQAKAHLISMGKGQLDLDIKAQHITSPGLDIDKLALHSVGSLAQHKITTEVLSSQGKLKLALKGTLNPQESWQGQLEQLHILDSPMGNWRLIQISPLKLLLAQQDAVQAQTNMCLAQLTGTGLLCINAKPDQRTGQRIDGSIKQLALSVFSAWIPDNLALNSTLNSHFSLLKQNSLQGDINIDLDPGAIKITNKQLRSKKLNFNGAQVNAKLDSNQLQSKISVALDAGKHLDGQVNILGLEQMAKAKIDAKLKMKIDSLSFLNTLIASVSDTKGSLNADIRLQGALSAPNLKGTQIHLDNAQFNVPDAGIQVDNLNASLTHGQKQQLFLKGSASIADQPLLINGKLNHYASDQLQFKIAAKGNNLQLLKSPEMQAWLSPNLTFSGNKHGVKIRGEVLIPKATIVFTSLPEDSVKLSKDEVIIKQKNSPVKPAPYPIDMRIFIQMGEAVTIEGFGLKSHLQGRLRAEMQPKFELYNQLTLLNATYKAYGQDLTIDKGQLLFAGDVHNTGVNIIASRKASDWNDKTIAYLHLTGMLTKPSSSVYTKPASNESDALAYLLTGSPLGKSTDSHAGLLAKAALSLGGDYINTVTDAIGIDELNIKSTAIGQDSMILSKHISPNLIIRYIVNILDAQMQLAVEYKLSKHISIETSAGSTQSGDIKYTIEFD